MSILRVFEKNLQSNSVTRQVSFYRTKNFGKWQNWKIVIRHFGWFLYTSNLDRYVVFFLILTFISLIVLFNWLITSSFWASLASISGIISFWKSPLVVFCKKVCTEPGHSVTFRPLTEGWSTISFTISFSWPLIALMRRKILQ